MRVIEFLEVWVFGHKVRQWDATLALGEFGIYGALNDGIDYVYSYFKYEADRMIQTEAGYHPDPECNPVVFKTQYPVNNVLGIYRGEKQNIKRYYCNNCNCDCNPEECEACDKKGCADCSCECVSPCENPKNTNLIDPIRSKVTPGKHLAPQHYKINGGCFSGGMGGNRVEFNKCTNNACAKSCCCKGANLTVPQDECYYIEYMAGPPQINCMRQEIPVPAKHYADLAHAVAAFIMPGLENFTAGMENRHLSIVEARLERKTGRRTPHTLQKK